MRHREEVLRFSWWQICVLALCLHVCVGQNNCPPTYSPYGCRTCFRVFSEMNFVKNFPDASDICLTQGDSGTRNLSVFNSRQQRDLIHTYLKLDDIKSRLWVGMRYDDNVVLVDLDGKPVNASALGIKFDEGVAATAGLCVSVMLSSNRSEVLFYRQQCSEVQGFICTISSIGLTVNNVTSSPDGYGIAGEQVKLRCNFQPTQLSIDIMWTFTNANGDTSVVMPTTEVSMDPGIGYGELVIPDFRDEHSGNYRCLISVLDGDNNVLGGITSAEKTIKLAVAPTLPHPPKDRTFFIGTVSFLECGVSNKTFPPPTVRWYKSEDEVLSESEEIINGSAEGKFFISPNTKTLLIADSEITDGSTYRCFVANAAGNVTSLGGQLTFESGSDVPANERTGMIVLHPADVTAELGSSVTYDCVGIVDCIDCDRYQWTTVDNNDNPVANPMNFARGEINSATYTNVQFFDPDDMSTFVAVDVFFNFGGLIPQERASLTVVERASITLISSNTMFTFGDEAQLWCSFRGTPPPDVQWYFKGRPITNSEEFTIQTTSSNKAIPGNTSLTIRNFQVKDTGSYQCVLTNYLASAARDFRLCGMDGTPGPVTEISILPVSQTQVRVTWSPPTFANSDPNLLQYRLYWADIPVGVTLDISTATEMTELLPFTDDGYLINDLNTVYRVSVIIVAYSYIGRGEESSPLSNRTYGSVPAELPGSVTATRRTNDNTTFDVTWDEVVPERGEGEGEVYRYDVSFFKCGDEDSRRILEGSHPPVTSMEIPDVDPDTNYTIQVRVTVLIQSEPEMEFAHGVWSGEQCLQPIIVNDDSDSDFTVIIIVVVVVVVLILIIAISGSVIFYVYQRGQRGRYFPAKSEEKKGTLRLKEQQQKAAIFSNGQSTGLTDDSASHPKTNGNFDA